MEDRHYAAFAGIEPLHSEVQVMNDLAQDKDGKILRDPSVSVSLSVLTEVAERIIELSNIVAQNALVAGTAAEAENEVMAERWSPPPQPELSAERKAQIERARSRATKQEGSLL